jgi:integrase
LKPTFAEIANEWFVRREEGKNTKEHMKHIRSWLDRYLIPTLGAKAVEEIKAPELLQILHSIEELGRINSAHEVKYIAGQVLQYAVLTGKATHNVAADLKGVLQPVHSRRKHHPSLTAPNDVAELMKKIDAYPILILRLIMLFSAYTFQRPGESRNAEWHEFDLDAAEWTIPPERMKRGRIHIVPLSRQVLEILRQLQTPNMESAFVFRSDYPSRAKQPINQTAVGKALEAMGYRGKMTPHGFRSLASTNLNAQGVDKELVEIQLSHRDEDYIRAAYNFADRLPERKIMMQNWADWLDSLYK